MAQQSLFAEATRRAAEAKFKQKDVDSEGKELEVRTYINAQCTSNTRLVYPLLVKCIIIFYVLGGYQRRRRAKREAQ